MIDALLIAVVLQWVIIVALSLAIVALFRQVGMLHERLGPVGALVLPGGPKVGQSAPRFTLPALDGQSVSIGMPGGRRSTLLFFLSPTCPVCKTLIPVIKRVANDEADRLTVVLASDGDEPAQRRMIEEQKLFEFPLVLSSELGMAYGVSKLPHAALIDADGRLAASGLINNREHLESLLTAQDLGVASLQEFLARPQPISVDA
ncbi:thiol-disulfide isomerase [Sandarakinorhabdus cyanobacteriorum]|uniref:Thiol-disulfide isomerase n=1 Tax=Sandarakinorhabdus cyanobacteriorum TaxID=1981098 RepID=A0A255YJW1_9SPHN|nr:redoxin family protein [Sandarakinorhabdus cyanobacteriorum]OYQ29562.1 thiol-disulfide isomerase [Sandarakinorhabdus cyanobacteriorum]